jgi:hypothetical protein
VSDEVLKFLFGSGIINRGVVNTVGRVIETTPASAENTKRDEPVADAAGEVASAAGESAGKALPAAEGQSHPWYWYGCVGERWVSLRCFMHFFPSPFVASVILVFTESAADDILQSALLVPKSTPPCKSLSSTREM